MSTDHAAKRQRRLDPEKEYELQMKAREQRIAKEFEEFEDLAASERKRAFTDMKQRLAILNGIPEYAAEVRGRLEGSAKQALRPADKLNFIRETSDETKRKVYKEAQRRQDETTQELYLRLSDITKLVNEALVSYVDVLGSMSDVECFGRAALKDPTLEEELVAVMKRTEEASLQREKEIANELLRIEEERLAALEKEKQEQEQEAKPAEDAKASEDTKAPEETKPAESKPVEETKPTETTPVETKPAETKTMEETKPVEESKPVEETKPAETKPVEESKPATEVATVA